MIKFKKILVPLDGSENSIRALNNAIEISKGMNAEIMGFHVFELPNIKGLKYSQKTKSEIKDIAMESIKPAMELAERAGVGFKYHTESGHVGSEIIKFAKKEEYDMIVIGARGESIPKESFLGSTTNYIINKSMIPVLIVK